MHVVILGGAGKMGRLIARELIEGPDPKDNIAGSHPRFEGSGGAMRVAVPAAEVARRVAQGGIPQRGVLPPEQVVEPLRLFRALERRGAWTERTTMEHVGV